MSTAHFSRTSATANSAPNSAPGSIAINDLTLRTRNLQVELGGRTILHHLDIDLHAHAVHGIIGPNGSGKTTLIRALCGAVPSSGDVLLGDRPLQSMSSRERARIMAVVWQNAQASSDITVRRMVSYGRYAHQGFLRGTKDVDEQAIDTALTRTHMTQLADRRVGTLSGGERQRAWLATALAQQPSILLLDEPTTYLDIAHQIDILELVSQLNHDQGLTVIMVLHDLTQAARYCDNCLVLTDGTVLVDGPARDALSPETIRTAFGVDAWHTEDPITHRPVIQPCRRVVTSPDPADSSAPHAQASADDPADQPHLNAERNTP